MTAQSPAGKSRNTTWQAVLIGVAMIIGFVVLISKISGILPCIIDGPILMDVNCNGTNDGEFEISGLVQRLLLLLNR